jgi:hypothetical protein
LIFDLQFGRRRPLFPPSTLDHRLTSALYVSRPRQSTKDPSVNQKQ